MPAYHVDFTSEQLGPFPSVETIASVEADSPLDAVARLLSQGPPPITGTSFRAKVVLSVHDDKAAVESHAERSS